MNWRHYLKETKTAWRKVFRPKVLITTTILILLLISFYFLFLLYKLVTADLTIMFWPNDIYTQENNISVSLRANNYLLCEATCTLSLTLNGTVLSSYENVTLRNNEFEAHFTLPNPPKGEGKEVYTIQAMCTSSGMTACYAREEPARESALVVHEYGLSREDERARQEFLRQYPLFLQTLRSIDESLIQAEQVQEQLLLSPQRVRDKQEYLENLLSQDERIREELLDWSFTNVSLQGVREQNQTVNELLEEYMILLEEENNRREAINNLEIDDRVGYILSNTTYNTSWQSFLNDYQRGLGSTLPVRYRGFEEQARIELEEQLLAQGHNITNTSFEERWDLLCNNCTPEGVEKTTLQILQEPMNITSQIPTSFTMPQYQCSACSTDRPVLFLHGHSMNERNDPEWQLGTFTQFTHELSNNSSFIDAGVMTPFSATTAIPRGAWDDLPVLVRGTYYYDTYHIGGSYILSRESSESIDTYAIRVRELVNTIQERTGSYDVDIVAHSMGGLVARRYVQLFGDLNVNQIITIGTPHYGIEGRTSRLCPVFGANKQCQEMMGGSAMLGRINDPERQPTTPITSIVGVGCDMNGIDGDGIITARNAALTNTTTYYFDGTCEDDVFHSTIVQDDRVVALVRELLSS